MANTSLSIHITLNKPWSTSVSLKMRNECFVYLRIGIKFLGVTLKYTNCNVFLCFLQCRLINK